MPAASAALMKELDQVMVESSSHRRAAALRRITDLFVTTAPRLDETTSGVFDDVLGRLVEMIETGVRAELSSRMAPLPNAPLNVIRRLARDDEISVAGPVLRHSPRLTSGDLVEIAESKSQEHLLAISDRPSIEPVVTDVLVDRGNGQVVRRVLSNPGASFSEQGLGTAVRRAENDEGIADLVARRSDVPPHVFCSLLARASTAVRKRMLAEAPPEMRAEIGQAVSKISDNLAVGASGESHDYARAVRRLVLDHQGNEIGEADIFNFARNQQFDDAVAAVSLFCKIPVAAVARMISSGELHPILFLGKAAGFDWPTIRVLILLGPRRTSEELTEACSDFNKLSAASAQNMLKYWQGQAGAQ